MSKEKNKTTSIIRTINGAIKELQKEDPETPVNYKMLHKWCSTGELPCVMNGNRYLIDMDVLHKFLRGELK